MKWDMVKLGDVSKFIRNGASIKQSADASGLKITRIETISHRVVNLEKCGYANINNDAYLDYRLKKNDILISHINSEIHLGKCAIFLEDRDDIIHGMNLLLLRPDEKIFPTFLFYVLSSSEFLKQIVKITKKSVNQASFTVTAFKELQIPLPPMEEQKRIAAILDKAHSIRQKRRQNLENADALIKSVFLDMFGDPELNSKKWNFDFLSNHLSVIGGYAFKSNMFATEGIPVLRIGNINLGCFSDKNLVFWPYDKKLDRYLIYPGDLLMSLTGTVGKDDYGNVCIMDDTYERYYLNQRNAKLELFSTVNKFYLKYILQHPQIKRKLTDINRGVRQANISNSDILNLSVPLPPIDLQNKFAKIVTKIEAQKAKQQEHLHDADQAFKALQQQFFG